MTEDKRNCTRGALTLDAFEVDRGGPVRGKSPAWQKPEWPRLPTRRDYNGRKPSEFPSVSLFLSLGIQRFL
jgi:hypothetical protein